MPSAVDKQQRQSRRQVILEALARELQEKPGQRITTAQLAKAVGVSEAALYRHFPSKAKMFEGLIEFIEESIFSLINKIMQDEKDVVDRCEKVIFLLLGFAEKNPGMARLLIGDALTGEHVRLRERICQFFDRVETQLKQILREARLQGHEIADEKVHTLSRLLLSLAEGRLQQFVRSGFVRLPCSNWSEDWFQIRKILS